MTVVAFLRRLVLAKRNSQASRPVNVATNHWQCVRVTRGLAIRRAKKSVDLTNDKHIKMCLQRFDGHAYTRLQFLRAVSHALGSEKILRAIQTRTTMTTPRPQMTIHCTQHQNDDDTSDDANDRISWRSCWLRRDVSRGTAWYTHRAGAVRSSTLLWVVCQRSAQPRTRLFAFPHASTCCVCTNLTYAWTCVWK